MASPGVEVFRPPEGLGHGLRLLLKDKQPEPSFFLVVTVDTIVPLSISIISLSIILILNFVRFKSS